MSLTFAEPRYFWLLFLLPLLVVFKVTADFRSRRAAARVAAPRLLAELLVRQRRWRGWVILGLELLALACFIAALARPQYGTTSEEVPGSGRNVLIALDTSRSMLATDLEPSRLERAKLAVIDLIRRFRGDRVGLIPFAGSAFLYAPLTNDTDALVESMDVIDAEIIPRGGSNLARAIELAVETYRDSGVSGQMALIILSDGEELEGAAIEAARLARDRNITIISIGVGTEKGGVIPNPEEPGGFHRDRNGKVVFTKLQRDVLMRVANETGGLYLPFGPMVAGDQGITLILEKLQRTSMKGRITEVPIDRFRWPLTAGLISLLAAWLTGIVRRHRFSPRAVTEGARPAAMAALAGLLLAGGVREARSAEDSTEPAEADPWALAASGNYGEAVRHFESRLKEADDRERARLEAGRGAAAYRNRDWETAISAFGSATLSPDVKLRVDAHYNLANAIYQRARETAAAVKPEDIDPEFLDGLIRQLENSLEQYQLAMTLDPDSGDIRGNHGITDELIQQLRKLLQEKQEQQGQGGNRGQRQQSQGGGQKGGSGGGGQGDGEGSDSSGSGDQDEGKEGDSGSENDNRRTEIGPGETEEERRAREESNREREGDIGTRGEEQRRDGSRGGQGREPGKDGENGDGDKRDGPSKSGNADNRRNPKTGFTPAEARQAMERLSDEDYSVRRFSDDLPQFQPLKDW